MTKNRVVSPGHEANGRPLLDGVTDARQFNRILEIRSDRERERSLAAAWRRASRRDQQKSQALCVFGADGARAGPPCGTMRIRITIKRMVAA